MANVLRTITLTVDAGSAGPLYDVYYSTDCTNYTICIDGSGVSLPTVGSTANVTFPDTTICIKLINLSSGCGNNFVVEILALTLDYLVVAGGGGAGSQSGATNTWPGGGGAGGFKTGSITLSSSVSLPIVVGTGGNVGGNGTTSSFNLLTSTGGGAGGSGNGPGPGAGSGGGSGGGGSTTGNAGLGNAGEGNNGVAGFYSSPTNYSGGGGGGAGGTGFTGVPGSTLGWLDGNQYAGGGNGVRPDVSGSLTSGSGGNAPDSIGKNGIVVVRYLSAFSASIGVGLTASTVTSGSYKITSFTAGSGSVTFS